MKKKHLPCQVQNLPDQALLCWRDTMLYLAMSLEREGQICRQELGKRWENFIAVNGVEIISRD